MGRIADRRCVSRDQRASVGRRDHLYRQRPNNQFLIVDTEFADLLSELRKACPELDVIYLDEDARGERANIESIFRSGGPRPRTIEQVVTDEHAPAVLCYTSGTTG